MPPPTSTTTVLTDVNWIGIGFTTSPPPLPPLPNGLGFLQGGWGWLTVDTANAGILFSVMMPVSCGKTTTTATTRVAAGERQRRLTNDWDFVGLLGCWGSGMGLTREIEEEVRTKGVMLGCSSGLMEIESGNSLNWFVL